MVFEDDFEDESPVFEYERIASRSQDSAPEREEFGFSIRGQSVHDQFKMSLSPEPPSPPTPPGMRELSMISHIDGAESCQSGGHSQSFLTNPSSAGDNRDEQYSQDFDQQRVIPHTEPPLTNMQIQPASTAASNAITALEKDGDSGDGDQKERTSKDGDSNFLVEEDQDQRGQQEGDNTVQNEGIHIR